MDPVTQGALGAIAAGSVAGARAGKGRPSLRFAVLAGWGSGMLADADIFIRSARDPLLNIEYHRHFTHSLLFVPLGALVAALILWGVFRRRGESPKSFRWVYLLAFAGYATAGLLDACTSYGTQLLWPFSNARVAWDIISIIDPIFTLTILALIAVGLWRRRALWHRVGLGFALLYLGFGVFQNHRAAERQAELANERGHGSTMTMATVKPSIGNLFLWRSVYRHGDTFHVDAIRVSLFGRCEVFEGDAVTALDLEDLLAAVPADSVVAKDLRRFDHFSAGYLAERPGEPGVIGDLRYAMVPSSVEPLWGIRYDPGESDRHVSFENFRIADPATRSQFFNMLFRGRGE